MSDVWKVEENDGIVIAAHDNPPMNYFVGASAAGLAEMLPRWREPDVRVVIITGAAPGRYITHYSVEELVDLAEDREELIRRSYDLIFGWHSLLQSLSYLDKPIIAAMTGDTGGGGLELSLNCDIRIMERGDYMCGFPEASLGILTGTGSQLLERAIGRSRALDFLLRSRYVSPEGALELGIVNELADDARARAVEVAERLRTNSAVALTAAKRSIVRGANLPMQEGLRVEAEEWLKTIVTDEALAAMKSYVDAPFDQRRAWVREHGAWPEPGSATGS
jgi:enoyl-CoA hydratase/carnithine racemase